MSMRAQERYNDSKGDFYAAGITYFTIFALFPLLMVGFAVGGFVLASQPDLLAEIEEQDQVRGVAATSASSWSSLMDSAIESRTSVGIIGLADRRMGRAGLDGQPARGAEPDVGPDAAAIRPDFVRTKLSDLARHHRSVRGDRRHHRADRARQFGPDEAGAGMVWAAGCSGCRRGTAGGVAAGVGV